MSNIIKPYEWSGTFAGTTPEQSKKSWDSVWEFINSIPIEDEMKKFHRSDIYDFMEYLEEKYPYKDDFLESLFDCITENDFKYYLIEKFKGKIAFTEQTIHKMWIFD